MRATLAGGPCDGWVVQLARGEDRIAVSLFENDLLPDDWWLQPDKEVYRRQAACYKRLRGTTTLKFVGLEELLR